MITEDKKTAYKNTYKEAISILDDLKRDDTHIFKKNNKAIKVRIFKDGGFVLESTKGSYAFINESKKAARYIASFLELNEYLD